MTTNPNPNTPSDHATPSDQDNDLLFKRSHVYAALLPLAFVTGLAAGFLLWGRQTSPPPAPIVAGEAQVPSIQDTPQPSAPSADPVRLDISVDDDPAIGPEDAPITIVEFSDFACGYCRRFHQQTFQALLDAFPDQIRFVYRDLPIVGGYEAAQAAECADEQGAFWEFHELLFNGELGLEENAYREYAKEIGIDPDALMECVVEGRYASEVEEDARYAINLGANGTPTFFINGIPLVGAQPLAEFVNIIETELKP